MQKKNVPQKLTGRLEKAKPKNRFVRVNLHSCGQKNHPVCNIYFTKVPTKVHHSDQRKDCIVHYNSKGRIVGIEFYNGIKI